MQAWFTVEQLDADTFAISEYRHWEQTHAYLLCGAQCALLVDTGLGVADIRSVVTSLTDLPVRVATTHVHWDHIGGHHSFEDIAVHEAERTWLAGHFPLPPEVVRANLLRGGDFPKEFDIKAYRVFQGEPTRVLRDGDRFELGGRTLLTVHTPGHSPGHCCFYEPERGYLFSGDLIYSGCLDAFYPTTNPRLFARSVRRVANMPVRRVWPGHHDLMIPAEMIEEVARAFETLDQSGALVQGGGIFSFGRFQIHI